MTKTRLQSGRVEYTDRAFAQDAAQAMKGDIVRGLIELITNADDAYEGMPPVRGDVGKIVVEVEHRKKQPFEVTVRDRATGIPNLVDAVTRLAGRTSGFELGKEKRGNLGRGAKDLAAFGPVVFRTIHDGLYEELVLRMDGTWDQQARRKPTDTDRQLIGVPRGTGTMVEVTAGARFVSPRHDTLRRKLSTHYALRDIMSDAERRVELVNLNDPEQRDLLTYRYPDTDVVYEDDVEIRGYGTMARLRLWRLPERCDEGPWDAGRPNGILVKGARAIYENTLFEYEGNVHAGWFGGELRCTLVVELAREYDDRIEQGWAPDPANPMNPILRGRDGLERNHPVYDAIRRAVSGPLGRLVEQEAEKARQEEGRAVSSETTRAFDAAARELGRMIDEELRDIEAEELLGLPGEGDPPDIQVVPEEAFAYMGEDRTLTVAVRRNLAGVGDLVAVSASPEGVVEVLTSTPELREHRRREDLLVAQVRLRPLLADEMTIVSARLNDACGDAMVTVRPPRIVIEPTAVLAPEAFEFERDQYRVGWKKQKTLCLRAPAEVVAKHGARARVTSSDEGVVVRTPGVVLDYSDTADYFMGFVEVEARNLGARAQVAAALEDGTVAETTVVVSRKEEAPGLVFRFDEEPSGYWRGLVDDEERDDGAKVTVIKIMVNHPSVRPYLGGNYEHQDAPVCRQVFAEVIADTAARMVVQKLYRMRGSIEEFDAGRFYREHYVRFSKFLPRLQRVLVGDPARAAAGMQLEPTELIGPVAQAESS
jgi:hypothetical protein